MKTGRFRLWKTVEIALLAGLVLCVLSGVLAVNTQNRLAEKVVRLHVLANSDSEEDQALKLLVRDAVVSYLEPVLSDVQDMASAKARLSVELEAIREVSTAVLRSNGSRDGVNVTLCSENFDTRHYDTFSLPAGVYSSLRISIGNAEGHNWWCVVFPSLCLPATGEGFQDVAAGAGFSDSLSGSLSGKKQYKVRFFLMDIFGKLENLFTMY